MKSDGRYRQVDHETAGFKRIEMNHNDLSTKLAQVIKQIPRDVLYDFCCSYAESHEELAMALRRVGGCLRE